MTQPQNLKNRWCEVCQNILFNAQVCRRHRKERHNPAKEYFLCPIEGCNTRLARKSEMKRHFIIKHDMIDSEELLALRGKVQSYFKSRN